MKTQGTLIIVGYFMFAEIGKYQKKRYHLKQNKKFFVGKEL